MPSLITDLRDSFKVKGLEYVSIAQSPKDPRVTILTYKDASGKAVTKDLAIQLSELQEALRETDIIDPDGLADFLLG